MAITIKAITNRIQDVCEENGWSVYAHRQGDDETYFEFTCDDYTTFGGEVLFGETMKGNNLQALLDDIYEYIDNYDADYEASLWSANGHGVHGAPYRLRDIIADKEEEIDMVEKLYNAMTTDARLCAMCL